MKVPLTWLRRVGVSCRVLPPVQNNSMCPVCNGTGWKAIQDGEVERVTRCDCWRERVNKRLVAGARIPRRYHHCTLDDFVTYDNDSLEDALSRSRKLADAFPVVDRGLFFLGDPGVGKTHLAVAILRQVIITRGARGIFYDTRDLLKLIRGTYNNEVKTTELEVLKPVMEADLLVLDDLGAEKTSEWVEETLNLIVNTRYNERRTTIFTSNYPDLPPDSNPSVITLHDRIGFRMRSRLHEMCDFLDLEGADYRMLLPNEGVPALKRNWEERRMRGKLEQVTRTTARPAKAQLRGDGKADLKWSGGRAGSK